MQIVLVVLVVFNNEWLRMPPYTLLATLYTAAKAALYTLHGGDSRLNHGHMLVSK